MRGARFAAGMMTARALALAGLVLLLTWPISPARVGYAQDFLIVQTSCQTYDGAGGKFYNCCQDFVYVPPAGWQPLGDPSWQVFPTPD